MLRRQGSQRGPVLTGAALRLGCHTEVFLLGFILPGSRVLGRTEA